MKYYEIISRIDQLQADMADRIVALSEALKQELKFKEQIRIAAKYGAERRACKICSEIYEHIFSTKDSVSETLGLEKAKE